MDSVKVSPAEGEITAVTPQDPVLSTAEGVAGDRDVPKVRNKLQLFAIVVALYVRLKIAVTHALGLQAELYPSCHSSSVRSTKLS